MKQFHPPVQGRISPCIHYKQNHDGRGYLEISLSGLNLLRSPLNKGTAFTQQERLAFGLEGLLPPLVVDIEHQLVRTYRGFLRQSTDLQKYQFLRALQERNEVLFFAFLERHLDELMPIVYTPTVGAAVEQYSNLYKTARGLIFTTDNIERADTVVANYPWEDVRMIVVTDSSAILGIGDQGFGGLAICIGKLALYTSGGGVSPMNTLPVGLDVGTNRKELLEDPAYLGSHHKRITGEAYFDLLDKFVDAVKKRWPRAVIQWEDFSKEVAFSVLARYRDQLPCFNDDIQGTGAVVLSGLLSACKLKGETLSEQRVVVVGAGAGGVGVAKAIQDGMVQEGLTREQARRQMYVLDGRGLVVEGKIRGEYKGQVAQFADTFADWGIQGDVPTLMDVVENAKPTMLLGLSGVAGLFGQPIIESMAANHQRPVIFPLSNPTSNCEALPEDIIRWTGGRAIIATGSPFDEVDFEGQRYSIGQGNNAFVFPGLGFAAILGKVSKITDRMVIASAYALADYHAQRYLEDGLIYPPISALQEASIHVTAEVLRVALEDGSSQRDELKGIDLHEYVQSRFWKAEYLPFEKVPAAGEKC